MYLNEAYRNDNRNPKRLTVTLDVFKCIVLLCSTDGKEINSNIRCI